MCQPGEYMHSHPPGTSAYYPVQESRCIFPFLSMRRGSEACAAVVYPYDSDWPQFQSPHQLWATRIKQKKNKNLERGCPKRRSGAGLDRVTHSICDKDVFRKTARNTRLLNQVYLTSLWPLSYAWALASRSLVHLSFLPLGGRQHSHLGNRLKIIPPFLLNERLHFSLRPWPYSPHCSWWRLSFKLQKPFFSPQEISSLSPERVVSRHAVLSEDISVLKNIYISNFLLLSVWERVANQAGR